MLNIPKKISLLVIILALFMFYLVSCAVADPVEIVVNSNDSGVGSLRAAISNVDNGGSISFDESLYDKTITLSSQIDLDKNVTILGPGAGRLTISGNNSSRIFEIGTSSTNPAVTISELTISEGCDLYGGGIVNYSDNLTLENVTFDDNESTYSTLGGGGLYNNNSSPDLINCVFLSNIAANKGGGVYNVEGSPTLTNCTFSENTANHFGGGGMCNEDSSPDLINCVFLSNIAANKGGGVYNDEGSPTLTNCTFSGNTANHYGGGMYNEDSSPTVVDCNFEGNTVEGNTADDEGGGGMYNLNCSILNPVINCTFSENSAYNGSGLYSRGSELELEIRECTFSKNNAANHGGGIYSYQSVIEVVDCSFSENIANNNGGGMYNKNANNAYPTVANCTFKVNSADFGGGMYSYHSWTSAQSLTNCTFSLNTANTSGGGMYNERTSESSFTLTNCTFTGNEANGSSNNNVGGGIYNLNADNSTPAVNNCIFWGNSPEEISGGEAGFNYCVISDDNLGDYGENNINTDPLLSSLTDNGGPTLTCALGESSSAIDSGLTIETVSSDQRGIARPWPQEGGSFDIGAFEYQYSDTEYRITATATAGGTITPASTDVPEDGLQEFTVLSYEGFTLSDLVLDESLSVSTDIVENIYTLSDVTSEHTLQAIFSIDPEMKKEAGIKDFQIKGTTKGPQALIDPAPVSGDKVISLSLEKITSGDIVENIPEGNFASGFSFIMEFTSPDQGTPLTRVDLEMEISRDQLGQKTCEAIDTGDDLKASFFENVTIYKVVSPDYFDLYTLTSRDFGHSSAGDFFEVKSSEIDYKVGFEMVIADAQVPSAGDAVQAIQEGQESFFFVYDGAEEESFKDPLLAVSKTAIQTPPVDDDNDDGDDPDNIEMGDGNCSLGIFPAAFGLLMIPLLFMLRS